MRIIGDRHGRRLELEVSGPGGKRPLGAESLEALLRLGRALPGKPELRALALEKYLGLRPAALAVRLWNGREFRLRVPRDAGNFFSDIHGILVRDQYDTGDLAGLTVVDAGANLGMFSLYALALGAKKVYAFEAVKETFALLKANLALNSAGRIVKASCAALGRAAGSAELLYNTCGEGSARLAGYGDVNGGVTYACSRRVKVFPLDSLVKGRADFIKIDAEGAEGDILLGAAGLIRRYKPQLSFSAYHRRADRTALPRLLRGIRPDYAIKLNSFAEQDFRCR